MNNMMNTIKRYVMVKNTRPTEAYIQGRELYIGFNNYFITYNKEKIDLKAVKKMLSKEFNLNISEEV